ncbi:MAG: urease accessory UreF family protein, partial [Pseudomonadota bacterium]
MDTATDIQIVTLAQWLSPAFPVGAFHFSHGLEWAIDTGSIVNGENLRHWIADLLEMGTGANDAIFLAAACNAATETALAEVDATARAFAPSSERLKETLEIGGTFGKIVGSLLGRELPRLVYPVAVGH